MTNRRPHILECVIIKFNDVVQFQESDLAGFRFKMHKMLIQANEGKNVIAQMDLHFAANYFIVNVICLAISVNS